MKTYLSLFILVSITSHSALAIFGGMGANRGCPSSLKNNHLVVSFEGLGDLGVSQANISNRYASIAGYTPANYPFQSTQSAETCIKKWKSKLGSKLKLSLLGHSCGGHAAINLAHELNSDGIHIDNMITFDPRCNTSPVSAGYSYQRPKDVGQFVNFQGTWGHKVHGANTCFVPSHTSVPAFPKPQEAARVMLSGKVYNGCGPSNGTGFEQETSDAEPTQVADATDSGNNAETYTGDAEQETDQAPAPRAVSAKPNVKKCEHPTLGIWGEQFCGMKSFHANPGR